MLAYPRGLFPVALFVAVFAVSAFAQTPKATKPMKPLIDPQAETLLQNVANRLRKAQSVSGTVLDTEYGPDVDFGGTLVIHEVHIFRAQKPNLLFHETRSETGGPNGKRVIEPFLKAISDGKRGVKFTYMDGGYEKFPLTQSELSDHFYGTLSEFFAPANYRVIKAGAAKSKGELVSLRMAPDKMYHGVNCWVVVQKNRISEEGGETNETITTYIGKNGIPRGFSAHSKGPHGLLMKADAVIKDLVFNRPLPAAAFVINTTGFKYREPIVVGDFKNDPPQEPIDLFVRPLKKHK